MLSAPFVWWLAFAPSAEATADRTYDLVVRAYCEVGTSCGFGSDAALEQFYRDQMRAINEAWRPTRVSFHLKEVVITKEGTYSAIPGTPDIDDEFTDEGLRIKELHGLAAQTPEVLTLFVLPKPSLCWSVVAPNQFPAYQSVFHGFFCAAGGGGQVLAHELGHHFCLPHPFTFDDPADQVSPNYDGDGIADTPWDPGEKERDGTAAGADVLSSGQDANGHGWCEVDQLVWADVGSPRATTCDLRCRQTADGLTSDWTSVAPDERLVMNYYGDCQGPFVVGGQRTEGFTAGQIQEVRDCLTDFAPRKGLTDVCASLGHDSDHDGICDDQDPCPHAYDEGLDVDGDGDGVPPSCDTCPGWSNPDQLDRDGDGTGDACDPDRDNDGCKNDVDLHPDNPEMRVGEAIRPGCGAGAKSARYAFEGGDADGDGTLDCAETDDDDDGAADEVDPCPLDASVVDTADDAAACESIGSICIPEYVETCGLGCGGDFNIDLFWDFDPIDVLTFDDIAMVDERVWLGRMQTMSAGEVMHAFRGDVFSAPRDAELVLQLREVGTSFRAAPVEIARFRPMDVVLGDVTAGLAVRLVRNADGFDVSTTWGVGLDPDVSSPDADDDGIPDFADLCLGLADPDRRDVDRDGFGDPCDADLDQDGLVDDDDLAFLQGCVGAEPAYEGVYGEPGLPIVSDVDPARRVAAWRCRAADLDGDGTVDADDVAAGEASLGQPPGPSAVAALDAPDDTDTDTDDGGGDEGEGGCGCAAGGAAGAPWFVGLVALGMARRRRPLAGGGPADAGRRPQGAGGAT